MALFPIMSSFVCVHSHFGEAVIQMFNSMSIDKDGIPVSFPR